MSSSNHESIERSRTIAVTGSTGGVGRALCAALTRSGQRVVRLVRRDADTSRGEVRWDPTGAWDASALDGIDALVHLAGENIAAGRWTAARKNAIMQSRATGTRTLSEKLAALARPPSVVVCASAIGYYGNSSLPLQSESAPAGDGFLAEVTRTWEGSLAPLIQRGVRTVSMRIGIVVSSEFGAVARMRLPFLLGIGGRVGSGKQVMSWIHIDDLVAAIRFAIDDPGLAGAVNAVAPNPVSQQEFARALARALGRPCVVPLPAWAVRLLLGEMGVALLLDGQSIHPTVLLSRGFRFHCERLDEALACAFR